ncbi:hypothetical protein SAMN05192549_11976 [Duganella sacchari]|uniref:Uncharacterized protein n=1 Tax=Duganella sacchari TaxID=551987 RepID=A0A1M7RCR8_9BURK|nr:hypothetical protein SAMN05192549_11976 [Duganella sacchari]
MAITAPIRADELPIGPSIDVEQNLRNQGT